MLTRWRPPRSWNPCSRRALSGTNDTPASGPTILDVLNRIARSWARLAEVHFRLAETNGRPEQWATSIAYADRAIAGWEALLKKDPTSRAYRAGVADILERRGRARNGAGISDANKESDILRTIEINRRLIEEGGHRRGHPTSSSGLRAR